MSLLDNFPHTAEAKIRSTAADGLMGTKSSYTTVFSGRACWRQPAGDSEIVEYQKRGVTITNKIYFTADPGLDERHVLVIGGLTYDVKSQSEPDASAGLSVVWRVMVNRTTTGSTP